MDNLPLRDALKRGALVTAANWPVVVLDFVFESFYKLALAVPIIGGALMVAALIGMDLRSVVGGGLQSTADLVLASLSTAPVALTSFLLALTVVAGCGAALMFALKAGTLWVLVESERTTGDLQHKPVDAVTLREAAVYRPEYVIAGVRAFGRRGMVLALWVGAAYLVIGLSFFATMSYGLALASSTNWAPAWPLLVLISTSVGVVTTAAVNLAYDLLRVIVVADDCSVTEAVVRLRRFIIEDARQVLGIFSVMGLVVFLATAGSLLAAAGLTLVAWVPIIGFAIVPLQIAAWLVRGIIFQYMSLAALAAYETQYRRFSELRWIRSARVTARSLRGPGTADGTQGLT